MRAYEVFYFVARPLFPLMVRAFPSFVTTSERLESADIDRLGA